MIKNLKKVIVVINLIVVLFVSANAVFGADLIDSFKDSIDTSGADDLKSTGGRIVGLIQVIGTIVSVAMITILGIKYMLGSADQKAEYRKSMLPYFIGAVLIFGFSNITQIIYEWSKNL